MISVAENKIAGQNGSQRPEVLLAAAVLTACVCRAGKETLVERPEAGRIRISSKDFSEERSHTAGDKRTL